MKHASKKYDRIQDPENKIGKDEPVLLIRAQDKAAVPAIDSYIGHALRAGVNQEFVDCLLEHKQRVIEWQEKNKSKVKTPDL